MKKERIYEKMNGFLSQEAAAMPELAGVEDEFAEGKECGRIYEDVYRAKQNLCERLGKDEDGDVETILSGMERIARLLSLKMYDYGRKGCGLETTA